MTNDLPSLIAAWRRLKQAGDDVVLAVVTGTQGSTYRKAGACMIITAQGETLGLLGGGCFESDLAERARRVFESGKAEIVTYDMRGPEDAIWGLGLGCDGMVEILLIRETAAGTTGPLALVETVLKANRKGVLALVCESGDPAMPPGSAYLLAGSDAGGNAPRADMEETAAAADSAMLINHPSAEGDDTVLYLPVRPPRRLLLVGAGSDAVPITDIGAILGWDITVIDHRESLCRPERFPQATRVLHVPPELLTTALQLDQIDAAVLMTHRFEYDQRYLPGLAASAIPYIGLLGPRARRERLLDGLPDRGRNVARRIYGPVGLDLGGELPEDVAMSLAAQLQAVFHAREGGHIAAPVKSPTASIDDLYTIVLAAGGSARFEGFKQLLEVEGESLLRRAVRSATEISEQRVIVVHGPKPTKCQREIAGLEVINVVNEGWQEGIAGSLRRGLSVLPEHCAGVLVLLCDQPLIATKQLRALVQRWLDEPERIVASAFADTFGVPAIFPAGVIPELLQLVGDTGAKSVISAHGESVNLVPVPEAELDIDTQDDYARILMNKSPQTL